MMDDHASKIGYKYKSIEKEEGTRPSTCPLMDHRPSYCRGSSLAKCDVMNCFHANAEALKAMDNLQLAVEDLAEILNPKLSLADWATKAAAIKEKEYLSLTQSTLSANHDGTPRSTIKSESQLDCVALHYSFDKDDLSQLTRKMRTSVLAHHIPSEETLSNFTMISSVGRNDSIELMTEHNRKSEVIGSNSTVFDDGGGGRSECRPVNRNLDRAFDIYNKDKNETEYGKPERKYWKRLLSESETKNNAHSATVPSSKCKTTITPSAIRENSRGENCRLSACTMVAENMQDTRSIEHQKIQVQSLRRENNELCAEMARAQQNHLNQLSRRHAQGEIRNDNRERHLTSVTTSHYHAVTGEDEGEKTQSIFRRRRDCDFSSGTKFVTELCKVMSMDAGTHGPLSMIMDNYWDRVSRKTKPMN